VQQSYCPAAVEIEGQTRQQRQKDDAHTAHGMIYKPLSMDMGMDTHTHTQRDRRATEHSGLTSDCRPRHTLHVKIALNYFTDQSALHSCDSSPEPVCMYVNSCNNTAARGNLSRPESHVMFSQRQPRDPGYL